MAALAEGTVIAGRYTLESLLGAGRHTRVWRATDADGAPFAVRILDPELAARDLVLTRSFRERTRRWRALGDVRGIWPILDAGDDPDLGVPFAVMPLAARSVEALVADEGPRPRTEALRIVTGVARGLDVLHRAAITHGNLHAANVLVADDGTVGIADLRLVEDGRRTRIATRGEAAERPWRHLAPELAAHGIPRDPTPAGDVYAAGVIAALVFTGRLPFAAPFPAVLAEHASGRRPDLHRIRPDLGRGPARLVRRALDPSPARRPRSGTELLASLVAARRTSTPRAGWEKGLAAMLVVLVIAAATIVGGRLLQTTVTVSTDPPGATVLLTPIDAAGPSVADPVTPELDSVADAPASPVHAGFVPDVGALAAAVTASRAEAPVRIVSPDTLRGLAPGRYRLVAEHPGYARLVREVTVGTGDTHLDDVVLEPGSTLELDTDPPGGLITIRDADGGAPILSERGPIRREGWPRRRYRIEAEGPRGTLPGAWILDVRDEVERHTLSLDRATAALEVTSLPPDARVLLDGEEIGRTPLRAKGLLPGLHEVEIRAEGFAAVRRRIDLGPATSTGATGRAGAVARVDAVLPFSDAPRRLELDSEPFGAEVYVAGERTGRTPLTIELFPVGRTHVQLVHPGRRPWARWIEIPREGTRVAVTLAR